MNTSFDLQLSNLNHRPYIHGTSLVKSILDCLATNFSSVENFSIRLSKKLLGNPKILIKQSNSVSEKSVANGSFTSNQSICYFDIVDTKTKVTDIYYIDEKSISRRIYQDDLYFLMKVNEDDDIQVCFNEISKVSNQVLFGSLPNFVMTADKQTWFVGLDLPSIDFLSDGLKVIGVSKEFKMLNKSCMQRTLMANEVLVGHRTCIYA
jgi:hypothetical protein